MTSHKRKKSKKRENSEKKSKKQALTNGMSKEVISDRSSENLLLPLTPEKLIDGEKKLQIADVEMLDIVVDVSDLTEKDKLNQYIMIYVASSLNFGTSKLWD